MSAAAAPQPATKSPGKEAVAVVREFDFAKTREASAWKYDRQLMACRFDPSGRFVFAGSQDYTIQRFNLIDGKPTPLVGHESWVRAVGFTPDGRTTFTGGYDGRLLFWKTDAEQPKPLRAVDAHAGWIRALAVSPDGDVVATCGNDRLVKLWNSTDGKVMRELKGHESHVYNVVFHPDGKHLASCDHRGVVKHWDLAKGTAVRDLDAGLLSNYDKTFRAHIGGARAMAFSADGSQLTCAGITNVTNAFAGIGNPLVVLFDWAAGKQVRQLAPQQAYGGTICGMVFHPAGFWVGAACGNSREPTRGALFFWKGDQPAAFHTVKLPDQAHDLALHPDGVRLAVAHADGALRIFELSPK